MSTYIKHNGEWKRVSSVTIGQNNIPGYMYTFESTATTKNGEWYNTEIPIAGVSKITLFYILRNTITDPGMTIKKGARGELINVSDGVLTTEAALTGAGGLLTTKSLKVVDGMIYYQTQSNFSDYNLAQCYMTLYK